MKHLNRPNNIVLVVFLLVIFSSCSTFLFQPVKKQIVGTWIADPVIGANPDTWTFNSDGTCTLVFNALYNSNGQYVPDSVFYAPGNATNGSGFGNDTTLSNVAYTISSSAGRYYLNIDAYATLMGYATNQFRFIIVKVNSTQMYLESQILYNPSQIGYIQIGFTKKQ